MLLTVRFNNIIYLRQGTFFEKLQIMIKMGFRWLKEWFGGLERVFKEVPTNL